MDQLLNIAICEDLPEERENLLSILAASKIPMNISNFQRGEDFLAEYQVRKFDLVFMDIYMGGMTGIETVTEIRKIDTEVAIVFTTTSLDYALESYRLEALKYLEKPVTLKSILPVLQLVNMQKEYVPKLTIRTKNGDEQIPFNDILFLEQKGPKFTVHLVDGTDFTGTGKIVILAEQLEDAFFFQCHKSFIVNFTYVKSLNKDLLMFEMLHGENVHIRRDSYWKAKKAYETFLFSNPKRNAAL